MSRKNVKTGKMNFDEKSYHEFMFYYNSLMHFILQRVKKCAIHLNFIDQRQN